jgi:hypothetical protein
MIARMAGTVLWAAIVFVVVAVLVSLGVLWWTGGLLSSVMVGLICGLAAAFTISAVSTMAGRTESPSERPDDRN